MSLQHIQKNSPRLLPKPAKFEKNPPNGYRVIRKTKCGAGGAAGAGGAGSSPIHKQASLAGRLIPVDTLVKPLFLRNCIDFLLNIAQSQLPLFISFSTLVFPSILLHTSLPAAVPTVPGAVSVVVIHSYLLMPSNSLANVEKRFKLP